MIRARVRTTLKDLPAGARMMKEVKALKDSYVKVGAQSDAPPYPNGATVAQVAMWNEFGAASSGFGYTPERSFFRSTLNETSDELNSLKNSLLRKVISGEFTAFKALDAMGFFLQNKIRQKIGSNIPPPNAAYTLKLKEIAGVAPYTLIMTGHMQRYITTKVSLNKGEEKNGTQAP